MTQASAPAALAFSSETSCTGPVRASPSAVVVLPSWLSSLPKPSQRSRSVERRSAFCSVAVSSLERTLSSSSPRRWLRAVISSPVRSELPQRPSGESAAASVSRKAERHLQQVHPPRRGPRPQAGFEPRPPARARAGRHQRWRWSRATRLCRRQACAHRHVLSLDVCTERRACPVVCRCRCRCRRAVVCRRNRIRRQLRRCHCQCVKPRCN